MDDVMPKVRLSPAVYKRLEFHAQGFDTPAAVIERILNEYESIKGIATDTTSQGNTLEPSSSRELVFLPSEAEFRNDLLAYKRASVLLEFTDGSTEEKSWNADKFTETSNLRGNLASGYLRGWSEQGIVKATFNVPEEAKA